MDGYYLTAKFGELGCLLLDLLEVYASRLSSNHAEEKQESEGSLGYHV